jgi:TPR repeat protein
MFESKAKIDLWVECGDDYYYGRDGETIDYEMASNFYFKAMKKKHPRATYMYGLCYELGRCVDADMEYAEILYEKAAEYGDADAKKRIADGKAPDEEQSPILVKLRQMGSDHKAFWARYIADQRDLERLLGDLSLPPVRDKRYSYKELEQALKDRRKSEFADNSDYAALTLALLAIKARHGSAALFSDETVRAYLTDFLPKIREMRRLSALVFDTDAITYLRGEPQKALRKLKARGLSGCEAERLIDCFGLAFAVTVDYTHLSHEALLAAAETGDTEAMYFLATQYFEDGDMESYRNYLGQAIELGHGPAQGLLEMVSLFGDENE